jgi:hypothetical protein
MNKIEAENWMCRLACDAQKIKLMSRVKNNLTQKWELGWMSAQVDLHKESKEIRATK